MPKVIIIEPKEIERSENTLKNIACAMEKIIKTEFGTSVKIELINTLRTPSEHCS